MSGIITVVQEGRFRLSSDDGRSFLFTLKHNSRTEAQDLPYLLGIDRVRVAYTTCRRRKSLAAHDIRPEAVR